MRLEEHSIMSDDTLFDDVYELGDLIGKYEKIIFIF